MNKQKISDELLVMAERLEAIEIECKDLKGYASGAAEVAIASVYHLVDLVRFAELDKPTNSAEIERLKAEIQRLNIYRDRMTGWNRDEDYAIGHSASNEPGQAREIKPDGREWQCVQRWALCERGGVDSRCCQFPKPCACE